MALLLDSAKKYRKKMSKEKCLRCEVNGRAKIKHKRIFSWDFHAFLGVGYGNWILLNGKLSMNSLWDLWFTVDEETESDPTDLKA